MFSRIKGLRTKIFVGYLLVVVVLLAVALWSINNFTILSGAINNIMVENYNSIKASESMIESIERQDSATLMMINQESGVGRETFRQNEKDFFKWLARAEDNITIDGEKKIIENISAKYTEYIVLFDEFYHQNQDEKWDFYNQEILPLFEELKNEIRGLRGINQETMVNAQQKADQRAHSAIVSTGIISVLAVVLAVVFGLYLSNQILKPVKELAGAISKVAERNFKQKINVKSGDEIGELADEYNEMIDKLQEYERMNINKIVAEKDKSEAIVNNITSPIIVTDSENRIVLLNQEAHEIFDIEDRVEDEHFLEIINNEELFNLITDEGEGTEEKNRTLTIESDGKEYHYRISTNRVQNKSDNNYFNVALLEDVTKLKKIDEMKSDFVSTVSHEFRTPLTSMNMSLNMVLDEDVGGINEDQKELLEAAYEDCERLNDLVDDLLDLSRIESGKIKMEFSQMNASEVINATIKPFKKQAEDKGVELKSAELEEEVKAWADSNKISWVISNLIGNALRYTEDGDSIEVGVEEKGNMINVYVEDTGIGIPEEYQDQIFEKFFRANNNDDSASGTGLGLAISKEIIEAHNGSIWVESEEGEGSKFIFSIPRYRHLA